MGPGLVARTVLSYVARTAMGAAAAMPKAVLQQRFPAAMPGPALDLARAMRGHARNFTHPRLTRPPLSGQIRGFPAEAWAVFAPAGEGWSQIP